MKTSELFANRPPAVKEVHVIWMTTGLSCDGDSVSVTAASQPSIEDLVLGNIPGLPKVHLHNPVLAYEVGDEFMHYWFEAAAGRLDPFVLVLEGSVPNEKLHAEGYWAAMGTDPDTDQPITTSEWLDRLAPKALAVIGCGTCATYGGIHAMQGNPTGAMGLADYLGWNWKSKAGLPIVNVPGCPVQPDNMMETLLYLLYQVAGLAPMIPLDDQLRPTWLFGQTVHEGCDRGGYYEQGEFAEEYGSPLCLVKIGCGFHEAVRGVLSHHLVIRGGKVANYHPYPPTPWNASPRDIHGTPGPYEDAVQNTPIFEENGPDKFKGIDIMRAVRSFDPCLPCGVHMYLGNDKTLQVMHTPTALVGLAKH